MRLLIVLTARLEYEHSSSIGTDKEFLCDQKRGDERRNDAEKIDGRKGGDRRGDFKSMRRDDRRDEGFPLVRASRGREKYRERDDWDKRGGNRDRDMSGRLADGDKAREIRRGLADKIKDDARRLVSRRGARGECSYVNDNRIHESSKQHIHAVRSSDRTFSPVNYDDERDNSRHGGKPNSNTITERKRKRGNSSRKKSSNRGNHYHDRVDDDYNGNGHKRAVTADRYNESHGNLRNNIDDNHYDSDADIDNNKGRPDDDHKKKIRTYDNNCSRDSNNKSHGSRSNKNVNRVHDNHDSDVSGTDDSHRNNGRNSSGCNNNNINDSNYVDINNYNCRHHKNTQKHKINDYNQSKRHTRSTDRNDQDQNQHDRMTQHSHRKEDTHIENSAYYGNGKAGNGCNIDNNGSRKKSDKCYDRKRANGNF